jgi:hypothetical protein
VLPLHPCYKGVVSGLASRKSSYGSRTGSDSTMPDFNHLNVTNLPPYYSSGVLFMFSTNLPRRSHAFE